MDKTQLLQNNNNMQLVKGLIKGEIVKYAVPVYSQIFKINELETT